MLLSKTWFSHSPYPFCRRRFVWCRPSFVMHWKWWRLKRNKQIIKKKECLLKTKAENFKIRYTRRRQNAGKKSLKVEKSKHNWKIGVIWWFFSYFPTLYAAIGWDQSVYSSLLCRVLCLTFLFVSWLNVLLVSDSESPMCTLHWCINIYAYVCHCHDIMVYLHGDVSTFFGIVSTCAIVLRCTSLYSLTVSPSKPVLCVCVYANTLQAHNSLVH